MQLSRASGTRPCRIAKRLLKSAGHQTQGYLFLYNLPKVKSSAEMVAISNINACRSRGIFLQPMFQFSKILYQDVLLDDGAETASRSFQSPNSVVRFNGRNYSPFLLFETQYTALLTIRSPCTHIPY